MEFLELDGVRLVEVVEVELVVVRVVEEEAAAAADFFRWMDRAARTEGAGAAWR